MKNQINLTVGDWSDDGHGKSDTFTIKCNLNEEEIMKIMKQQNKKYKFNFVEDFFRNYEERTLSNKKWSRFKPFAESIYKKGFLSEDWIINEPLETYEDMFGDDGMDAGMYAEIFCYFIKDGHDDFQFEFIEDTSAEIRIGGYGLYH